MVELLLLIVAVILLYLLLPIVAFFMILKYIFTFDKRILIVWFYRTARAIDVFANVNGAEFFNAIFIIDKGYRFGNPQETISSVIGKNQRDDTLSLAGKSLRWMLDQISPYHCLNSINENATNTKKDTH